ncbi:hypothetical protein EYF80_006441 [Liparis tanakae]|uniref:Uncharacterized protein n=1 Tax=Liparis tanakae TaxID=230148 RepID=A0A4Z2IZN2_9TELE|nr:hypothetical protein EYF80_006441 [Liparis tanakae]
MPCMVPNMVLRPRLSSIRKNSVDQKGLAGKRAITSLDILQYLTDSSGVLGTSSVRLGPTVAPWRLNHSVYSSRDTELGSVMLIQGHPTPSTCWLDSKDDHRLRRPRFLEERRAMFLARKPSTTKTTSEASTDVMKLMPETISASLWQLLWTGLYGNLHTLPRPTLNPTCANTYWTLESQAGRSASHASTPSPPSPAVS